MRKFESHSSNSGVLFILIISHYKLVSILSCAQYNVHLKVRLEFGVAREAGEGNHIADIFHAGCELH